MMEQRSRPATSSAPEKPRQGLFRRQAVAAHAAGHRRLTGPLEISPRWIRWVEGLVLLVVASAILFGVLGTIGEYAQGTAMVLMPDRSKVSSPTLIAVFPGHYRPVLGPGMPLHLSLRGYGTSYQRLTVDRVEERILGPLELDRLLDTDLADAMTLSGPLAIAFARLPGESFEIGNDSLPYHHGLQGTVEILIRSERILSRLLPPLAEFLDGDEE